MPTSTTKISLIKSDFKEISLLGPLAVRTFTTRQYVVAEGAAPSLTKSGTKPDTWAFSPIPGAYRKYYIYQSPSSAPKNKYTVVNATGAPGNPTLKIEVVDSLDKATPWAIEHANHPNVYRFAFAVDNNQAPYRWVRQDNGKNLLLQHLGTDIDKAAFVLEETSL